MKVQSCVFVLDREKYIARTVFKRTEMIKKTSSANANTVAHRQKTEVFLALFHSLLEPRAQNFNKHARHSKVKRVLVSQHFITVRIFSAV